MGYSAKAVGNYFLDRYRGHGITPLKLQKLVYLAHGWNFVFRPNVPLIEDEHAEAWRYGPVFPSLYYEFRDLGRQPISRLATELELDPKDMKTVLTRVPRIPETDGVIHHFLGEIWRIYGGYSGVQLSELCHKPQSPWYTTRAQNPTLRNANIDNELIRRHYDELYKEYSKHG